MPALAALALAASIASGCHTIDAAQRLGHASPAHRITLTSVDPRALTWVARYGESGYPDNIGSFFSRDVDYEGTWQLPRPTRACVAGGARFSEVGADPVVLHEPHYELLEMPTPEQRLDAANEGCTDVVMLRPGRGFHEIVAVELIDVSDESELRLALPRESPVVDPRRWLWLASAPVFDTLTLVALPPFLVALVTADAIDRARLPDD